MRSCVPPITVPAWSVMTSGCDPGRLGVYGFRNRTAHDYSPLVVADSKWVRRPRIWDMLGEKGLRCVVIGVPGTWPVAPIHGVMVGDFLTPGTQAAWTHPPEYAETITRWLDGAAYPFDVKDYRGGERGRIREEIFAGTRKRFEVARRLWSGETPDFFMFVEMGCDRAQHVFWEDMETGAPEFGEVVADYYRLLDEEVGRFVDGMDLDSTRLLVVSDHGAMRCHGGFCINEWLRRAGLLVLKDGADRVTPETVNWARTTAWAEGGYYARIFLNVAGREPEGVVEPARYEHTRAEIAHRLAVLRPPDGGEPGAEAFRPEEIYESVKGVAPDLLVYFGGLRWRAVAGLTQGDLFVHGREWGLDGANHAPDGFYCLCEPGREGDGTADIGILDVLPLLLGEKSDADPVATESKPQAPAEPAFTADERAVVEKRLRDLGYFG